MCSFSLGNLTYSPVSIAIGADLFAFGICSSTIAVTDSLITYSRYKLLVKQNDFSYLNTIVAIYLGIFIIGSSLLFYTIIPIFVNVNCGAGLEALNACLYYIYTPAFAGFNLYFSVIFIRKICWFRQSHTERHPKLLSLAYKSCIHSLIR